MEVFVFGTKVKSEDISPFNFTASQALETGPDGRTALHIAALQGDLISLTELLHRGADISATDTCGMTALHVAAAAAGDDKAHICELLLDAGAAIDAADYRGDTALHHAARVGSVATVKMLLERGARIVGNGAGRTARSVAVGGCVAELFAEEEDGRWWERVLVGFGAGGAGCEGRGGYGPCGVFEEGGGCKFCSEFYVGVYEEAVRMEVDVRMEEAGAKTGGGKRKWEGGK